MKTVVIQTSRTGDIPGWLSACLNSVETWAAANSWAYRHRGDDIFDLIPKSLRRKFSHQTPLQIDIARLLWAQSVLRDETDVERVIWLDADVLVFDPDALRIDPAFDFAVGRQVWVQPGKSGTPRAYRQVHNAVLVITRFTPVLDFLVQTVIRLAERHEGAAAPQLLGPKLLTALHNIAGFPVVDQVGMISPLVLRDLASGSGPALTCFRTALDTPLAAANLCSSYRNQIVDDVTCDDPLFDAAVKRLKTTGLS